MSAAGRRRALRNPGEIEVATKQAAMKLQRQIEQLGAKLDEIAGDPQTPKLTVNSGRRGRKHVIKWNFLSPADFLLVSQPVLESAGKKLHVPGAKQISSSLPFLALNKGRTRKNKLRVKFNRTARNPIHQAEDKYEEFHGRPAEEMVEIETKLHEHTVLSGLGTLKKLVIRSRNGRYKVTLTKFGGAILAQNEDSNEYPQLYIEGGDQSVDLAEFGLKPPYHEKEELGTIEWIYYATVKDHLGEDGGDAIYKHKLERIRSRGREKPVAIYDVKNKLIQIAGGAYTIQPEGIEG